MMKKNRLVLVSCFLYIAALQCLSCTGKKEAQKADTSKQAEQKTEIAEVEMKPLYELAAPHGFMMGGAIGYEQINNEKHKNMLKGDFNSVTFTNELKAYSLLDWGVRQKNGMPALNFNKADQMMDFAQEAGLKVRGHVLVWDAYMTEWFFYEDYKNKTFASKDVMLKRLQNYIEQVITHFETKYPGVIYAWDVVNEAVGDGGDFKADDKSHVRTTRGGTKNLFYETIGHDYVKYAFKYAYDCIKKNGYDITLFYNDYNTFQVGKRTAICNLIDEINAKDKINPDGSKLCQGIGMQCYVGGYGTQSGCMNPNDIRLIKEAIEVYAKKDLQVQITEMAVRNYQKDNYSIVTHAEFYGKLAKMIKDINSTCDGKFTCWAIWGLLDNPGLPESDYSYKMNGPYCGLYTWDYKKKDAYKKVNEALAN